MNMNEIFVNASPEQKAKATHCKSAEELFQLAKSEGMDLSAEDAAELFSEINGKTGEISDDDLDNVAGGKGEPLKCKYCQTEKDVRSIDDIVPREIELAWSVRTQGVCSACLPTFKAYFKKLHGYDF